MPTNILEDIRDTFAIFHDGTVTAWAGDRDLLTLTIECEYVELLKPHRLEFVPGSYPEEVVESKTDIKDIFKEEFEILYAKIKDSAVYIDCISHGNNSYGGCMIVSCEDIRIYDQNKNLLTIDMLDKISNEYWGDLAKEYVNRNYPDSNS
jgi:hypothetical protein